MRLEEEASVEFIRYVHVQNFSVLFVLVRNKCFILYCNFSVLSVFLLHPAILIT